MCYCGADCVFLVPSAKPKVWWRRYYIAGFIAVSSAVCLVLLVSVVLTTKLPAGYTGEPTAQRNVLTVTNKVDPFWYERVTISIVGDNTIKLSVASQRCSDLVSKSQFKSGLSATNLKRERGNEPLQLLWNHGYLVDKSTLNLTITIVDPPTNGAAPALYQLNNWTQYWSLLPSDDPPSTDQYITRYPISRTGNTTVSITVTSTDFHFFFLYLPATTVFQYQFSLNRYYYSPDDYNFTCNTSSTNSPCKVTLATSYRVGDIQCLLVLPKSSNSFPSIRTTISRYVANTLSLSLISLMGLLVLLTALLSIVCLWVWPCCGQCCIQGCCCHHQETYKEFLSQSVN